MYRDGSRPRVTAVVRVFVAVGVVGVIEVVRGVKSQGDP